MELCMLNPRGSHEKHLKEIVSPVFEIRHGTLHVGTLIDNMSSTGLYDCHIF